jgi:transcriptional regulator with XRE-family HTH domain
MNDREANLRLGRVLRALREEQGWSQRYLAAKIGCSQRSVSGWETGKMELGVRWLPRVAMAFGLTPAELLAKLYPVSPRHQRVDQLMEIWLRLLPEQQELALDLLSSIESRATRSIHAAANGRPTHAGTPPPPGSA